MARDRKLLQRNADGRYFVQVYAESGGSGLRVVGIFYKPSNLSFSRDRFSYGGFLSSPSKLKGEDIDAWLAFLASGLAPGHRPKDLRRAFAHHVRQLLRRPGP